MTMANTHGPTTSLKRGIVITPDANGILYVKQSNATSGAGDSWDNAVKELADALKAAEEINAVNYGTVKEIWITGGTYKPLYKAGNGTDDRSKSFVLVRAVKIYGGFAGSEKVLSDRDLRIKNNATILSGDLKDDDEEDFANYSDNVHHIIIGAGELAGASVDGFTIQGGNADGLDSEMITVNGKTISRASGGGVYCNGTVSPSYFRNLNICHNYASEGGAFFAEGTTRGSLTSNLYLENSKVYQNKAKVGAALVMGEASTAYFINVLIADNVAKTEYIINNSTNSSHLQLTNVTLVANIIEANKETLLNNGNRVASRFYMRNTILLGNYYNANDLLKEVTTPIDTRRFAETNCLKYGTGEKDANNNFYTTDLKLVFKDPEAGNFQLKPGSIAIDMGNKEIYNFADYSHVNKDLLGNNRIYGDNVDLGAYEWQKLVPPIAFANLEDDKIVATYGDADFSPSITSTLPVTFSVADASGKASIVDNKIQILEAGEVVVTLNFAGNDDYEPFTLSKTLLIKKASQTITFPILTAKQINAPDFEPLATTASDLPISYTTSDTNIADVYQDAADGNKWKIKVKGIGEVYITAVQAGNVNYANASFLRVLRVEEPVLPVVLSNYQAKLTANKVVLTWATQSEQNNKAFVISHASDGQNFKVLSEVQGKGTSTATNNYQYQHSSPLAGTNYYKLQQVDFNGDIKELGIRTVDFKLGNNISLYPNPVVEKATVVFETGYQLIEVININGSVLQRINVGKTDTSKEISLANYSPAVYFIKLIGIGKTDICKLVKY